MVLRCSLLGHDYGEAEVEREREERGSEVVVTVQEYEECVRCGERNVISENTEVTSLSTATVADSHPEESDTTAPTDGDEPTVETAPETPADTGAEIEFSDGEDDAEFIDADDDGDAAILDDDAGMAAGDDDSSTTVADDDVGMAADDDDSSTTVADDEAETAAADEANEIEVPTDDQGEPVTDDGEILEDEEPAVDRDRDHGEWPDSDDVGPPVGAENKPEKWPDDSGPAETDASDIDDAEPSAESDAPIDDADESIDDAVVLEDDSDPVATASESGAAADARSVTAEPPNAPESQQPEDGNPESEPTDSGTGIERAAAAPTPGKHGGTASEEGPTEFYCPRCEYVASGDRGSLRAGDICPECRKGYLGERERR